MDMGKNSYPFFALTLCKSPRMGVQWRVGAKCHSGDLHTIHVFFSPSSLLPMCCSRWARQVSELRNPLLNSVLHPIQGGESRWRGHAWLCLTEAWQGHLPLSLHSTRQNSSHVATPNCKGAWEMSSTRCAVGKGREFSEQAARLTHVGVLFLF